MCGIIGYIGEQSAAPIIIDGLARLEYRGYDSTGIAIVDKGGTPQLYKSAGKLSRLKSLLGSSLPNGNSGVGHTRWATHGSPTDCNAHPHTDCESEVLVVHNGIVENYPELRQELTKQGHTFGSKTDTECIPHLIESYMHEGCALEDAVCAAANRIRGANAAVVLSRHEPNKMVAFKIGNSGGIVIGYGEQEMLLSSDISALLPYARKIAHLAAGEMVTITRQQADYSLLNGASVAKPTSHMPYNTLTAAKGEYKHFMLKEIHEQPEVVINTMRGRVQFHPANIILPDFTLSDDAIRDLSRVIIIGMGTSLHAGMVGRMWMESIPRIAAEVDNSSEFRYRDAVIDPNTLIISISQSGETADTLAAMEEAKRRGARQLVLCNYEGTQASRVADDVLQIRAGLEIGVAATKTFVCSLLSLYILATYMGVKRGTLSEQQLEGMMRQLVRLPEMIGSLTADQSQYQQLAALYTRHSNFLYLGRGKNYPLAMEGALKLKEISYIHAEGYPAGEMKHGPISLIDENMPVVALIPQDNLYEKMLSNINEVKARGGIVIAVATEGDRIIGDRADHVIHIPQTSPDLTPILTAVPMQLLAYHIAVRRGCDVDQPRNLAKSVTVE